MLLKKMSLCGALALVLSACMTSGAASESEPQTASDAVSSAENSPFVGRYDGGSFETAMGMEIAPDGTFQWFLAVGSLNLRAEGTWEQKGEVLYLTSDPAPVPPEFRFLSVEDRPEDAEDDKLVHVTRPDGRPFTYAEARIECANGERISEFVAGSNASKVRYDGYVPPECDRMIAVTVEQSNYNVLSPRINLREVGWKQGQVLRFEFAPNDIGVADFTGMMGALDQGVLRLTGGKGLNGNRPPRPGEVVLELRKLPPPL